LARHAALAAEELLIEYPLPVLDLVQLLGQQ